MKLFRYIYLYLCRCAWIGCLLLIPSVGYPAMYGNNVAGGTFFIDTSSGVTQLNQTQNMRRMIKVVDTSGKQAIGYVGPAGTGEKEGAQVYTENSALADPNGTEAASKGNFEGYGGGDTVGVTTTVVAAGTRALNIYANGVGRGARNGLSFTTVVGALYKSSCAIMVETAGGILNKWASTGGAFYVNSSTVTAHIYTGVTTYFTPSTTTTEGWYFSSISGGTMYADNLSLRRVIEPPTSGCSIYDTPAYTEGTKANNSWLRVDTGFNWNAISYYAIREPLDIPIPGPMGIPMSHRWRVIR